MTRPIVSILLLLSWALAAQNTPSPPSQLPAGLSPDRISLAPDRTATTILSIHPGNVAIGTLPITITGLPPGVTFTPAYIAVTQPDRTNSVTLTFTAGSSAAGTATASIQVGSGTTIFSTRLTIGVTPAAAAPPPPTDLQQIWEQVQHWGTQACRAVNTFDAEAFRWVCTVIRMARRAANMIDQVQSDFQMLKDEGINNAISVGLNALGVEMGIAETNQKIDQLEQDFTDWRREYRRTIARVQAWMQRQRQAQIDRLIQNPYQVGSPAYFAARAVPINPDLIAAEVERLHRISHLTEMAAAAGIGLSAAAARNEEAVAESSAEAVQTMIQVAKPDVLPVQTPPSDVEYIRERAAQAPSTREVMQVLVESQARIMQQNLVNSQSVVEAVRQTSTQQVYTTQQLTRLLELEIRTQIAEANRARQALFDDMQLAHDEAQAQSQNLYLLAMMAERMANFE